MHYELQTSELPKMASTLRAGDTVSLSGIVYTARDAAHKRMAQALSQGEALPFALAGAVIYYAGPTPAKPGQVIGSVGPTTSGRMDRYTPTLLAHGLCAMIGKGQRDAAVAEALRQYGAVYMVAIGGAGAAISAAVRSVEVIAYDDLGCESIKRLEVEKFAAIVTQDSAGGNLYEQGTAAYRKYTEE